VPRLKIRRALLTVSDKSQVVELAQALAASGAELVATGRTALVLKEAGLKITPIEQVSGSPEAFQGRMKTLSFPVCSGILARRGDASDDADLARLKIQPIDCVVVNFYPFEKAAAAGGERKKLPEGEARKKMNVGEARKKLIEEVDIGGPTLVRAAAKNAPNVLVLTDPAQYSRVIDELSREGSVSHETSHACASRAWDRILAYDTAIAAELGERAAQGVGNNGAEGRLTLRYGENPHQKGSLDFDPHGPLDWGARLTATELSYNNILDLSSAYSLASDLAEIDPHATGVVIVKHNNPCGVALVPKGAGAQKAALLRAWEGDPVSAFGGVLAFTDELEEDTAAWLSERFVELVAAPHLSAESAGLRVLTAKRKNLKAVPIRRFGEVPAQSTVHRSRQSRDLEVGHKEAVSGLPREARAVWDRGLPRAQVQCDRHCPGNPRNRSPAAGGRRARTTQSRGGFEASGSTARRGRSDPHGRAHRGRDHDQRCLLPVPRYRRCRV